MRHDPPLHRQKHGVLRAIEILKDVYELRIVQKKSTEAQRDAHLKALDAVFLTIDALDAGKDARRAYNKKGEEV